MTLQRPKDGFFTRVGILFLYGGLAAFLTAFFYGFTMNRVLDVILAMHKPEYVNIAMSMATHIPVLFMLAIGAALMVIGVLIFICEATDRLCAKVMHLLRLRKPAKAEVQP